ncbi:MAG: hypothetical protein APG10_01470 [Candidatus Methanofastidiosum methylothiophilum]|uniref:Lysine biosynthesis protein LysW n=1 Tax=Candidatus Methanofastidiosum methylothiophilum TaxID=1705564 RepID=A0A150IIL9_9EURY|nr:MAG: hypothetical protein APG10_01470 [Candidatus Methanofastidiosum methylthiophilus]
MGIGRDRMKEIDCPVCLEVIEFKELKDGLNIECPFCGEELILINFEEEWELIEKEEILGWYEEEETFEECLEEDLIYDN